MSKNMRQQTNDDQEAAMERMNKALKAAMETPPRKHADEPKRGVSKQIKSPKKVGRVGKA